MQRDTMATATEGQCDITIRFSSGAGDLEIKLPENSAVHELKERIYEQQPELSGKFLRLICSGRMLQDQLTLRHYGISDDGERHFIHCLASDITPAERQAGSPQQQQQQAASDEIQPARGFDRLRESGFSEEDIQGIRQQFHRVHGTDIDDEENARAIEDSWIDGTAQDTVAESPLRGSMYQLLGGLLIGYFGGLISLPWLKNTHLFSRQHQMGIIFGVIVNLSFGFIRWLNS
ncbi:hypothetical protein GQ54DRAFT_86031 [Martensiomyces pterosporus]|nr:hypothetical protein GQ54DRAFT_86031 [Martensiomyces pterosporus]